MGHEVQQTRWDRIVRRVSGSIGPGSRVSETLTEAMPVLDLENMPAELLVLGGTRMCTGFTSETAVAALFQHSELFNPVDSGSIITLLSMAIDSGAVEVGMVLTSGSFTTEDTATVGFVDGRLLDTARPVGQMRHETAGAIGAEHYKVNQDIFNAAFFQPPKAIAVLTPGSGYSIHARTANEFLDVSYSWLERPAEESELSL